jgi:hypothetical protein
VHFILVVYFVEEVEESVTLVVQHSMEEVAFVKIVGDSIAIEQALDLALEAFAI